MRPRVIVTTADYEIEAPPGVLVINWRRGTFTFNGVSTKPPRYPSLRFKLMATVISCPADYLSLADIYEAVFGDDDDGGPLELQQYWLITKEQYRFYHPAAKRFVRIAEWLGLDTKSILCQGPYWGIRINWLTPPKYVCNERVTRSVRRRPSEIAVTQTA